ncbi:MULTISPECIES: serine hydrolase [unclassified Meiothermus]|uniref:serine hydrolase domain-containing protein n=1 Tax=unclassified Meiothermus TaxID=370471 RepID=UPI000D7BE0A2|nr:MULTISPECIES: serine hydrolase domain-containing protein [unclassified Meiothermus]PZA06754.1 esterase [Meiothermus sp. Pnk-1]RYM37663.1 class A beta-lactamase-related serine hydrolase [Meiothermus sp. PNK-Is4]
MIQNAIRILQSAIDSGQIPGAALGVVWAEGEAEGWVYGKAQLEPEPVPLEAAMFFDLASLTKVLFTVPEVLRLVEDGLADLDDPLARFFPEMAWMQGSPLPSRTLRQLLTHTSGLPAWAPIYTWGTAPQLLKQQLLQHRWEVEEPGPTLYSDVGYILLGLLLERLRGKPLRDFPLPAGLTWKPNPENSVATERCPWRGRVLRGEIHDENAFALGGAGHAGLFGTLAGVLEWARSVLNGSLLSQAALEEMTRPQTSERALGWVLRQPGFSGGSLCSPRTIGHTGFTGTGVWIDLERGYAWALLTHRVHPSRHRESGIIELRRTVGNAIAASYRRSHL